MSVDQPPPTGTEENPRVHRQPEALPRPLILVVLGACLGTGLAVSLAAYWLFVARVDALGPPRPLPPPGLLAGEEVAGVHRDLVPATATAEQDLAAQRASLDRAAWVDRERGLVAIPIDTAMELVADGGQRPSPGGQGRRGRR